MTASNQVIPTSNVPVINAEIQIDENTMMVLKDSLYPGAKDNSIKMVVSYCKARRIDPMLKPVHIVPMNVKTGKKDSAGKDIYEWRDTILPGIGLYRIDASRSGQYAGMSEPEFGQDITEKVGSVTLTYPKWCKVTARKLLPNGNIAEFTAKELWKENYATKGRNDSTPNAMWEKRSYGQLAKCAEAQALRKAFPDIVGQEYTKEEMEGKSFAPEPEKMKDVTPTPPKKEKVLLTAEELEKQFEIFSTAIEMSETIQDLQQVFGEINKINFQAKQDLLKELVDLKDHRKGQLMARSASEAKADPITGEVEANVN